MQRFEHAHARTHTHTHTHTRTALVNCGLYCTHCHSIPFSSRCPFTLSYPPPTVSSLHPILLPLSLHSILSSSHCPFTPSHPPLTVPSLHPILLPLSLHSIPSSSCCPFTPSHPPPAVPSLHPILLPCQPQVRAAAVTALNAWHDQIGLTPLVEAEIISTALATENPNLRSEVPYVYCVLHYMCVCVGVCVCVCVWVGVCVCVCVCVCVRVLYFCEGV